MKRIQERDEKIARLIEQIGFDEYIGGIILESLCQNILGLDAGSRFVLHLKLGKRERSTPDVVTRQDRKETVEKHQERYYEQFRIANGTDPRDKMFHRMKNGRLRAVCLYNGLQFEKCTNNDNSMCCEEYIDFPRRIYHDFDGKNCIKCHCG